MLCVLGSSVSHCVYTFYIMCDSNVSNLIYGYEFIYKETLQETQTGNVIYIDVYNFRYI